MIVYYTQKRRLAQNREAARKSRLRKKVPKIGYIHDPFTYITGRSLFLIRIRAGLCSTTRVLPVEAGSVGVGTRQQQQTPLQPGT